MGLVVSDIGVRLSDTMLDAEPGMTKSSDQISWRKKMRAPRIRPVSTFALAASAFACALVFSSSAWAQLIGPGPAPSLNVTAVPPPGALGYDFVTVFGPSQPGDPNNTFFGTPGGCPFQVDSGTVTDNNPATPGYPGSMAIITFNAALNYFDSSGYGTLTIGGVAGDHPGFGFVGPSANATNLATVTLGSGSPSSFIMGIEENNTGGVSDETSILLSGAGGTSQLLNAPVPGTVDANDFYYVTVTAAAPGDVITVSGINPSGNTGFSGITFDPVSVPEPVTMSLLVVAGVPLLMRRKRA